MLFSLYTTLYALSVVSTGALCVLSQVSIPGYIDRKVRLSVMVLSSLITEYPQVFLLLKFLLLRFATSVGVFTLPYANWLYSLDVLIFLVLWAFFLQSHFARYTVEEQTKRYRVPESHDPPGFFMLGYWFRLLNPFWSARNVMTHPNICYATDLELKQSLPATEPFLSLDIHIHPSYPRNRPVLIYIHGGSWSMGDKTNTPPFLSYMALKHWVVVSINYRLSPFAKYPDHLIDVKRAIRWVRSNIARYGGDPSFVAISGGSAGGHLAAMAAMTQNDPFYQPGFEDVDTSIQACVPINAVLDVTNHKRFWKNKMQDWFARHIAGFQDGFAKHEEFLKLSSPVIMLKQMEAEKRRSNVATTTSEVTETVDEAESEQTTKLPRGLTASDTLPPFLLFHGRADHLVPHRQTRDFVQSFKRVSKSHICYVEFPNANHIYDVLSAPRGHYMAYGIERFLGRCWDEHVNRESGTAHDKQE
ncbi:hypothetical protein HDU85_003390 [Gaertneriomyces sp. JEL0708]|nr:hypothetical protein HDU85_003390 [Gaertneriomyces sp. JEL0708]